MSNFVIISVINPSTPQRVCSVWAAFTGAEEVCVSLGVKGARALADGLLYPTFKGLAAGRPSEYVSVRLEPWHEWGDYAVRVLLYTPSVRNWCPQTLISLNEARQMGYALLESSVRYA